MDGAREEWCGCKTSVAIRSWMAIKIKGGRKEKGSEIHPWCPPVYGVTQLGRGLMVQPVSSMLLKQWGGVQCKRSHISHKGAGFQLCVPGFHFTIHFFPVLSLQFTHTHTHTRPVFHFILNYKPFKGWRFVTHLYMTSQLSIWKTQNTQKYSWHCILSFILVTLKAQIEVLWHI
jgi:hypothetical protein